MTRPMPIDTGRRAALLVFATLQLLDFLTSMAVFARGGSELNPIVRSMMPWTGPALAMLIAKIALVALTWRLCRRTWIINAGNALYVLIVVWNGMQTLPTFA